MALVLHFALTQLANNAPKLNMWFLRYFHPFHQKGVFSVNIFFACTEIDSERKWILAKNRWWWWYAKDAQLLQIKTWQWGQRDVAEVSWGREEGVSCLLPSLEAVGGVAQGALKARHSSLLLRLELSTLEVPSSMSSITSSWEKPSSFDSVVELLRNTGWALIFWIILDLRRTTTNSQCCQI